MRDDVIVSEVLAKCDVLIQAGFWPPGQIIRPNRWLNNFDEVDRGTAALLLDKFTFYNQRLTDALLGASYNSLGDGIPKGPAAPFPHEIIKSLSSAILIPVTGEDPNPADSGNLFCRKARQVLDIPEALMSTPENAITHADAGNTVVFVDDFIGSGDQFLKTWRRRSAHGKGTSFEDISNSKDKDFIAIYISLVATEYGLDAIFREAPKVVVSVTHILGQNSKVQNMGKDVDEQRRIDDFLRKYSSRLEPKEDYIRHNLDYLIYGYKERGLLFGFEHSIPDATLPIFWAPGNNNWEPLIERK
ncbi:MAG: hypothetical protein ABW084_00885 [Candidatus Thiodiazotropha sp.]